MTRIPDSELAYYENTVAKTLRIQGAIKRLIYQIDDPDVLADLVIIAEASARIRKETLQAKESRRNDIQR